MLRALLVAFAVLVVGPAIAAELPAPLPENERAELVAKWRKGYDAALAKVKDDIADAKLLSQTKGTASEGKVKLATANAILAAMTKNPTLYGGGFAPIYENGGRDQVGSLTQPSLTVAEVNRDGVIVEGLVIRKRAISLNPVVMAEDKIVARYLIASPLPAAKKGAKVNLEGLWHVAGEIEHNEKRIPVLYRFEIKKDELPAAARK